jgi:hypothetical protein
MKKLKLYVWEGVLTDYTSGMVCVLARSEEEAWKLVEEKQDGTYARLKREKDTPRCVEQPEAFICWGGG